MFKENVCGGEHNIQDFDPELKILLSEFGEDLTNFYSILVPMISILLLFTNCIIYIFFNFYLGLDSNNIDGIESSS